MPDIDVTVATGGTIDVEVSSGEIVDVEVTSTTIDVEILDTGPQGPPGTAGAAGVGVPTGGTDGQVLAKASGDDFDTEWVDQTGGGGGAVDSVNGQTGDVVLTADDVGAWPVNAGVTSTTDDPHTIVASSLFAGYQLLRFLVDGDSAAMMTLGTLGIIWSTDGVAPDGAMSPIPARGSISIATSSGGLEVSPYGAGSPAKVLFVPYGVDPLVAAGVYAYDGDPNGALDAIAGSICFGNGLVYMQNDAPHGTNWDAILDTADILDGGAP